ncbi:MAG: hypothetical protein A2527_11855 [Candidatus Lambdaproteobacteria bacterium RIFOXYD2_FULL_50_16]|uniref:Uncharacterized protein n=1 Tax=Candidatus Lambdaproteobacteria bacterium RIFOXYD2_FULL_50_16 TaxID=1817772 RepID=A0A1F6G670_9PROT|nr:MAG: hypothetical protein A2527_11855 [Candidatus Lambdaproteobacteria bacterium RIFOXYD2_FULL_50_16]
MAKWANDLVMDQGLEYLKYHANNLVACAGQPTNYAEAIGANFLGMITLSIGHLNVSDGVISGRRLTVSGRMGLLTQVAGLADHFALIDSVNQVLLYVTEAASSQQTYAQNSIDTPDWDITIADPV